MGAPSHYFPPAREASCLQLLNGSELSHGITGCCHTGGADALVAQRLVDCQQQLQQLPPEGTHTTPPARTRTRGAPELWNQLVSSHYSNSLLLPNGLSDNKLGIPKSYLEMKYLSGFVTFQPRCSLMWQVSACTV